MTIDFVVVMRTKCLKRSFHGGKSFPKNAQNRSNPFSKVSVFTSLTRQMPPKKSKSLTKEKSQEKQLKLFSKEEAEEPAKVKKTKSKQFVAGEEGEGKKE